MNWGNLNKLLTIVKLQPPSTKRSVPVIYEAAGLPKNNAAFEISLILPNLWTGIIL